MSRKLFFLQIALVGSAWAQDLPTCAESCLQSSTPFQGKCSNVDIGCLCTNIQYIDVLACCLSKTCNTADQQVAQAFNQALCAGVNVVIPNFLGCGSNTPTTKSAAPGSAATTTHEAGIELAVNVPTTGAVANFNGHALLTGTCSIAHPVLATVDNGGILEYPRLGCSNEEPGCCPYDIHVGGPLSICPEDYTTTSSACCPSGWSIYTSDLAGITPCFTTTPLELATSTTLNINVRDIATHTPISSGPLPITLAKRQSLQVHVISTHLFTLRYPLVPSKKSSLSTGAKVGIAVGAGCVGLLLIGLTIFWISKTMRARRERRAAAAGAAFAASGIASPMTGYSTQAPSMYAGRTGASTAYARSLAPDRARSPISPMPIHPMQIQSGGMASPAMHVAPMELPSEMQGPPVPSPPLPSPPPGNKIGSAIRDDSLSRHPASGGNFRS